MKKLTVSTPEALNTYRKIIECDVAIMRSNLKVNVMHKVWGWEGPRGESLLSMESERLLREIAKDILHFLGEHKRPANRGNIKPNLRLVEDAAE